MKYWTAVAVRIITGKWKGARIGLVHGDTASTLFGALAMRLVGARVGHVEAGLRSPHLLDPFPEEIIRRLVSRISALHFVPNEHAASNLCGARGEIVRTQGNTLRDALTMSLDRIADLPQEGGRGGYAIASIHRNENLSRATTLDLLMEEVLAAATRLPVKFVLHPATRQKILASGWLPKLQRHPQLELMDRMDYPDFVRLLIGSRFLLTDGGSNQEEAAMLGLPTLLLRRSTERQDGLGSNVVLSGLQRDSIREFIDKHAACRWPLLLVADDSPTSRLVDALESALRRSGQLRKAAPSIR